jgi:hypothetical protein
VIDVRYDAKIARQLNRHGSATIRVCLCAVNRHDHAICPLLLIRVKSAECQS